MNNDPLSEEEERIGQCIVDSAFTVHKTLGPGLLEGIYEVCFCHELGKRRLTYRRQVAVPIIYDTVKFDEGFRLDVLVEDRVICELKAVDRLHTLHMAQMLTQLKLTGKRLGFLINFNTPIIKRGIQRIVL